MSAHARAHCTRPPRIRATLPPATPRSVVAALQLANEPALNSPGYDAAVKQFYRRAVSAARRRLPELPLLLSFIPPNDLAVPAFVRALAADAGELLVDHHWYLNWASPDGTMLGWDELHRRACHEAAASWSVYTAARQPIILGEWSLATNHDAPLDLSDGETRANLARLFREQLDVYASARGVIGSFYWTLRMGSGWDPRPSEAAPRGSQAAGSSARSSLAGYPYRVWSLLEMAELGVATPLNESAGGSACAAGAGAPTA